MDVPSTSAFTPNLPAASGSLAAALASLPPPPAGEGTLAGIAGQLGMSPEDLQSALRQGQSIAGLAEQQGVPRDSIASFIGAQIQRARLYSGQPALDDTALERLVNRALDRGRPQDAGTPTAPQSFEAAATASYASNARPLPTDASPGGTISLLV